jgi:mannose-1-phosphate guanylyltransferase
VYVVVLAGGGGTRLFPLSSPERPKPFLPLLSDETLLQRTVARLAPLASQRDVTVVTLARYAALVREQLPEAAVLSEPVARNTAAAIALAATRIERPLDEVMLVLPADHLVTNEAEFRRVLAAAEASAAGAAGVADPLVTLGVRPSSPSREYGYLIPRVGATTSIDGVVARGLDAFEEKPDEQRARMLLTESGVAWNAGIFLWQRRAILDALNRHTTLVGDLAAASDEESLASIYEKLAGISIDYAVLEPAAKDRKVVMLSMDAGWSDLGGWPSLLAALGGSPVGRVIKPGQEILPGPSDLVLSRRDGKLELTVGTSEAMSAAEPMALFADGLACRAVLSALIDRVG